MSPVRRLAARLAVACVLSQLIGAALPPVLLWATTASDCACTTGDHAMCPMHHQSRTRCAMRAAADDGTAMLAPLATLAFLPGPVVTAIAAPARSLARSLDTDAISRRPVPPDPPPPRA